MILLNYDATLYQDNYLVAPVGEGTELAVSNAKVKELFVSNNPEVNPALIPEDWDNDTVMHAKYNNSLVAGNTEYTVESVSHIALKSREIGSSKWITLMKKPINSPEDFFIEYLDTTARAGANMEYAVVPVSRESSYESENYETVRVTSDFEGIMLAEKGKMYRAYIYDFPNISRNHITSTVTTLKSPFPFIVKNSRANYVSGSINAGFLPLNQVGIDLDYYNVAKFREEFADFLTNGVPKLLKLDDGRSWIVSITDQVSQQGDDGLYYTNFQFVQTGDATNNKDLFDADIIDDNGV